MNEYLTKPNLKATELMDPKYTTLRDYLLWRLQRDGLSSNRYFNEGFSTLDISKSSFDVIKYIAPNNNTYQLLAKEFGDSVEELKKFPIAKFDTTEKASNITFNIEEKKLQDTYEKTQKELQRYSLDRNRRVKSAINSAKLVLIDLEKEEKPHHLTASTQIEDSDKSKNKKRG